MARPKLDIKRPSCPKCKKFDEVVAAGYSDTKRRGKERRWFCNRCSEDWNEGNYIREIVSQIVAVEQNEKLRDKQYRRLAQRIVSSKSHGRTKGESETHESIKHKAAEFLRKDNTFSIFVEYKINLGRIYSLDVVGLRNGKVTAIECGSISSDKQSDFWDFFSNSTKAELYWLPYNAGRLFKITPVEGSEQQFSEFGKYSKAHK